MKAISIKQPWAGFIAQGFKTIETRTWQTKYRGDILICASAKEAFKISAISDMSIQSRIIPELYVKGNAICIAELYHIEPMTQAHENAAMCEVYEGAYSWHLRDIRLLEPFPVKGKLNIYEVEL